MDRLGQSVDLDTVKALDRANMLKRNLTRPPIKDTVTVPDGGYTILRVHASNPGNIKNIYDYFKFKYRQLIYYFKRLNHILFLDKTNILNFIILSCLYLFMTYGFRVLYLHNLNDKICKFNEN